VSKIKQAKSSLERANTPRGRAKRTRQHENKRNARGQENMSMRASKKEALTSAVCILHVYLRAPRKNHKKHKNKMTAASVGSNPRRVPQSANR
jgi:hypothetical protein